MPNINTDEILNKYRDAFQSNNAIIYKHNPNEDSLLLKWWIHLHESGDINRLIKPSSQAVTSFFNIFSYPTILIYSLDTKGEITHAGWITPEDEVSQIKTAHSGLWTHQDKRGTKQQYNFTRFYYSFIFEFFDALLGITWQQDLLDQHTKLGYDIVGCIPDYYGQPFCYIVHLKRDNYINSRFYQVGGK